MAIMDLPMAMAAAKQEMVLAVWPTVILRDSRNKRL